MNYEMKDPNVYQCCISHLSCFHYIPLSLPVKSQISINKIRKVQQTFDIYLLQYVLS